MVAFYLTVERHQLIALFWKDMWVDFQIVNQYCFYHHISSSGHEFYI